MEVKKVKKPVKLSRIFIKYIIAFLAVTLFAALFITIVLLSATESPPSPDFVEKQLNENREKIESTDTITPGLIPAKCSYAVYSKDGIFISGSIGKVGAEKAWNVTRKFDKGSDFSYYYVKVPQKSGECIVRFSISREFQSPVLQRCFPTPGAVLFVVLCIFFILALAAFALIFQKKFDAEMKKLQNATEKIKSRNLNFNVEHSFIYEVDNALESMDNMKETLKESLKKQWDMEDMRRRQISALAHDVKTPITIVRGNAELLTETNETDEQKEYTNYIKESTHEMEQYIKVLIEISKAEIDYDIKRQDIESKKYMDDIHESLNALAAAKNLKLNFDVKNIPESFNADDVLLKRAIMNVASNAADYSPSNGTICFSADTFGQFIKFCITDSGSGFSKEALSSASEEFYMGDSSRTSKLHYGMGLYIAKSIANLHGGKLTIANSISTGGGEVTIEIPMHIICQAE